MTRIHHATAAKAKKFGIALTIEDNEIVAIGKGHIRLASGLQGNKVLEDAITKATGKPAKGTPAARTAEHVVGQDLSDPFEAAAKEAGWKKTRWGFRNSDDTENKPEATTWQDLCEEVEIEVAGEGEEIEEGTDDEQDEDSDADQSKSIVKAKYKAKYKPTKDKCGDSLSFEINEFVTVEDEETGEKKVSKKLLRAFAEANGCWVPSYGSLVSRTGGWNAGMARMNVANRLRAKIRQAAKAETKFEIVWPKV